PFEYMLDRRIHWPSRKCQFMPVPESQFLKMLAYGDRQDRPHVIIGSSNCLAGQNGAMASVPICCIALQTQVVDDLRRIERQIYRRTVRFNKAREISQSISSGHGERTNRGPPKTCRTLAKREVTPLGSQFTRQAKVREIRGTTIKSHQGFIDRFH